MKTLLIIILVALSGIGFYYLNLRNDKIDEVESEIKIVLDLLYKAQMSFFQNRAIYADDFESLATISASHSVMIGLFSDCSNNTPYVVHDFIGPTDKKFEEQAQKILDHEAIRGKCTNLANSFTAFAAQNLDGDDTIEVWTINEKNQSEVLVTD